MGALRELGSRDCPRNGPAGERGGEGGDGLHLREPELVCKEPSNELAF